MYKYINAHKFTHNHKEQNEQTNEHFVGRRDYLFLSASLLKIYQECAIMVFNAQENTNLWEFYIFSIYCTFGKMYLKIFNTETNQSCQINSNDSLFKIFFSFSR